MKRILAFTLAAAWLFSPLAARAEVFSVGDAAAFQAALDTAAANGEDDTINVAAGLIPVGPTPLTYFPTAGNFALSIIGAPNGASILDGGGNNQILSINTAGLPRVRSGVV